MLTAIFKKSYLFAPTLIAVLAASAGSAYLDYHNSYVILHDAITKSQIETANDVGRSVASAVAVARRNAATLGRMPAAIDSLINYNNPDFKIDPRLRELVSKMREEASELQNVALINRAGNTCVDGLDFVDSVADRDYFLRAKEEREGFVAHTISARTGKRTLFYISPVVSDNGEFLGLARVSLDLGSIIQEWLLSLPPEKDYRFRILSEQGRIIGSSVEGENDTDVRSYSYAPVFDAPPETLVTLIDDKTKKERLALMVKAPLKEKALFVIVGVDKAAVFARMEELTVASILINISVTSLVMLVIVYTLTRLFKTIKHLEAANQEALLVANAELERNVAERTSELQAERMLLRTVFDAIPDVVFYKSVKGVYLTGNTAFMDFWHKSASEVFGKTDAEMGEVSEHNLQKFAEEDRRAIQTRKTFGVEDILTNSKGEIVHFETIKAPGIDTSGKVLGVLGICRDITKRKEMEATLESERVLLRTVLDTIPDIVFYKSADGVYRAVNRALVNFVGKPASEIVGKNDAEVFGLTENDAKQFVADDHHVMQSQELLTREENIVNAQGEWYTYETTKAACVDASEKVLGVLGISRDITQRKAMESELVSAREQAVAGSKAKSEFLANMSHEIRTPMNGIIGLSHLALQTEDMLPQVRDYVGKIDASAKLLLRIINDILDFSKIEAGKLEIEHIPFRLEGVLESVIQPLLPAMSDKGLELVYDLEPNLPVSLVGDPTRLGQVILNLLSNAIKFTHDGSIIVRIKTVDESVLQFEVADTGIGISQEKSAQLFEAFAQADTSITRRYGGTGLGLTICKSLVHLMGGEIGVNSVIGQGTTFSFTVKLGRCEEQHTSRREIRQENLELIKKWHILVIDDNEISRHIIEQNLLNFGTHATLAESGEMGIDSFERAMTSGDPFDVVIVDWKMPGIDGIETARRLRAKHTDGAKTPVMIMVTAHERELIVSEAKSAGIAAVLAKPVTPSALCDTILTVYSQQNPSLIPTTADTTNINSAAIKPEMLLQDKRVLLAEDNPINQLVATHLLKSYGCIVTVANNGLEAVKQVTSQQVGEQFDVVLMDIQMPEMDGIEATQRIRENQQFDSLPIIAMTAHAMTGDEEISLQAGMQAHVTKPIDPSVLFATLVRWVVRG